MIAAIQDYRCSKVSNVLIYLSYSVSIMFQCINNNGNILSWFIDVMVPIMILFLLFYLKMLGAADIKLLSVISGFYGWRYGLYVFLDSLIYGVLWSVLLLYKNRNLGKRLAYLKDYLSTIIVLRKRIRYLGDDSQRGSYTIPYSVVILLAFITRLCLLLCGAI